MAKDIFTLTCLEQIRLTPTVTETIFSLPEQAPFEAGQFLTARIPNPDPDAPPARKELRRSYSIATPPEFMEGRGLGLCVKLVEGGPGSTFIQNLKPGQTMDAQMPFGKFVWRKDPSRPVVFLSTGTGISPFRSMMLNGVFREGIQKVISLAGYRTEDEILYGDLLSDTRHPFELQSITCISRPVGQWNGFKGRVTDYLYTQTGDWDYAAMDFYLCGSGDMIKEVKKYLLEDKQVEKEHLFQEVYF